MDKLLLIIFLGLQIFFWSFAQDEKPNLGIMPVLPSQAEIEALSFGDKQLYFRAMAMNLQMAGDTFGRTTPLKDYDYPELLEWFRMMDTLDWRSNFIPSIAAYYFSRTQNTPDVKYMVEYLLEHGLRDPEEKWWWLSQGIYLANHVIKDKESAFKMAQALKTVEKDIPMWARQMEVFLREDLGETGAAEEVMCEIIAGNVDWDAIPEQELNFMTHFFEERLKTVEGKSQEEIINRCTEVLEQKRSKS